MGPDPRLLPTTGTASTRPEGEAPMRHFLTTIAAFTAPTVAAANAHPLNELSADKYVKIGEILKARAPSTTRHCSR